MFRVVEFAWKKLAAFLGLTLVAAVAEGFGRKSGEALARKVGMQCDCDENCDCTETVNAALQEFAGKIHRGEIQIIPVDDDGNPVTEETEETELEDAEDGEAEDEHPGDPD